MTTSDVGRGAAEARRCVRPDLLAELATYAEATPQRRAEIEQHASVCPECGPALDFLRRAEDWIEQRIAPTGAPVCPSAEELFDYGRGFGSRRMSEPERLSLRAHLAACSECSDFVETLTSRPPTPLVFDALPNRLPRQVHNRRRLRYLIPLAAAAVVAALFIWTKTNSDASSRKSEVEAVAPIRFPVDPPVRGVSPSELLFPRDRVLRTADGPWSKWSFEVAPQERAARYRIVLREHDGGAFEFGRERLRLESATPHFDSGSVQLDLPIGHYTWEAWAIVDGLDVALGRRDFEVAEAPELVEALAQRASAPEPMRSESMLHLLHDAGFVTDARAYARTLPASAERDAYLARLPTR